MAISYQNIRSYRNKFGIICGVLQLYNYDILCLSETWLNPNEVCPIPPNYSMYRQDRTDRGGGVAILIKNEFKVNSISLPVDQWIYPTSLEIVSLAVQYKYNKSFIVSCVYRTAYVQNDIHNLENCLEYFSRSSKKCFVLGDFNINILQQNTQTKSLLATAKRHDFKQIVNEPTRNENLLDVIFVNDRTITTENSIVKDLELSDHKLIELNVKICKKKQRKVIIYHDYEKADWESVGSNCIHSLNSAVYNEKDTDILCNKVVKVLNEGFCKFVPTVEKLVVHGRQRNYLSHKSQRLVQARSFHYEKWKTSKLIWHSKQVKLYNYRIKDSLKEDMKKYVNHHAAKTNIWDTVKNIMNIRFKRTASLPTNIDAEELNKFYCEMGFPPGKPIVNSLSSNSGGSRIDENEFVVKDVNQTEIFMAWRHLKRKLPKSLDTTGLSKFYLNQLLPLPCVHDTILALCKLSFAKGIVPSSLKISRIVPIPKVENASTPAQFRPISLQSNILMLLEKIYYDKLVSYLTSEK